MKIIIILWQEAFALANLPSDLIDELDEKSVLHTLPHYPSNPILPYFSTFSQPGKQVQSV